MVLTIMYSILNYLGTVYNYIYLNIFNNTQYVAPLFLRSNFTDSFVFDRNSVLICTILTPTVSFQTL